ncbi:MAG: alanine dehydrogenase [Candidatus Tectomicrobia bacterium]|uniref:Alanine dehydrogenase n=1 Tax=Tectimicrobiota bacterium TaxID=2528274 RepID=A0A932HZZ0_UNCTE|nr:alanine dehydrogenase [Candidatus Tectomicrobia bacterium]
MIVGIPKEIKKDEHRVALSPGAVEALAAAGHTVLVEKGGGAGAGIADKEYEDVGGRIALSADEMWRQSDMIVKVKEPLRPEYARMREGQILFAFLHLAAAKTLARVLLKKKVVAIAFETVRTPNGSLPLLQPMSEIAGRMAVQEGAKYLEKSMGGRGVLLSGAPGVPKGNVVILGAGMVGKNAAKIAVGLNADVTVLDVNHSRLEYVDDIFGGRVKTLTSTRFSIREAVRGADILIGAVLLPGARAPLLVPRPLVKQMNPGSVIVDVAVDQGGCVETIRPTYHSKPTYVVDGVIHYGVANMPGGVPRTSTFALSAAILPYTLELANLGAAEALRALPELAGGLNAAGGRITHPAVAEALGMKYARVEEVV